MKDAWFYGICFSICLIFAGLIAIWAVLYTLPYLCAITDELCVTLDKD
jgi:hypothetical protein